MRPVDDILRRAKRLKRHELSRVVKELEAHLSSRANGNRTSAPTRKAEGTGSGSESRSNKSRTRRKTSYARTLALAGMGHSDLTDVSLHKGKHLADVYSGRREG